MNKMQYSKLVKEKSPGSKFYVTMPKAFVFGGVICLIGEIFRNVYMMLEISTDQVASLTSVTMIFIGAFLTGIGVYDNLAKHGGAGTAVPITGFANAIVSPAIEHKSEGLVMGVGAKMFIIAGPVLVYGTLSSIIVGIIYFLVNL